MWATIWINIIFGSFVKIEVMSLLEIKKEIVQILDTFEDEQILEQVKVLLSKKQPKLSIEDMYADAINQYGNTLRKLAQ